MAALVLVVATGAHAHDADVVYVLAQQALADPGSLVETVTLTAASLGQLAPVDANGDGVLEQGDLDARAASVRAGVWDDMPLTAGGVACSRAGERARLREGYVELEARFQCGEGELRQDFRFLRVLPTNYRVVLGSQLDGERNQTFAQGTFTALTVPRPRPREQWSVAELSKGFGEGLARALGLLGLASVLALALPLGGRRQVALAAGGLVVGLVATSWVEAGPWAPAGVLVAAAVFMGRGQPGLSGMLVGAGLGLVDGGGEAAHFAGLVVGSAVGLGPVLVGGAVVGRMLKRRGRVHGIAVWVMAGVMLVVAVLYAAR